MYSMQRQQKQGKKRLLCMNTEAYAVTNDFQLILFNRCSGRSVWYKKVSANMNLICKKRHAH